MIRRSARSDLRKGGTDVAGLGERLEADDVADDAIAAAFAIAREIAPADRIDGDRSLEFQPRRFSRRRTQMGDVLYFFQSVGGHVLPEFERGRGPGMRGSGARRVCDRGDDLPESRQKAG